jgi:hypothetical protein
VSSITAVYYTANRLPDKFMRYVQGVLLGALDSGKAGERIPLISVSQKPMDFGFNICVGDIGASNANIYRQLLAGAKAADTEYVACCEDDCLYVPEHFRFRPHVFGYDMNRWNLCTWPRRPVFDHTRHRVLNQMIAPRRLLIDALCERFERGWGEAVLNKWSSEPGKHFHERKLRVKRQEQELFQSPRPNVLVIHPYALGFGVQGTKRKLGKERRAELAPWGSAATLLGELFGPKEAVA